MWIPCKQSTKALNKTTEKKIENSIDANRSPCYTCLVTLNGSESTPPPAFTETSMKGLKNIYKGVWATKLMQDLPKQLPVYRIKCFCQIYKNLEATLLLFIQLFLKLVGSGHHIHCPSFKSEFTLGFWKNSVHNICLVVRA